MRTHDYARLGAEIPEGRFPDDTMPRRATRCTTDRVGDSDNRDLVRGILQRERKVRAIFPGLVVAPYGKARKYAFVGIARNAVAPEGSERNAESFPVTEYGFLQTEAGQRGFNCRGIRRERFQLTVKTARRIQVDGEAFAKARHARLGNRNVRARCILARALLIQAILGRIENRGHVGVEKYPLDVIWRYTFRPERTHQGAPGSTHDGIDRNGVRLYRIEHAQVEPRGIIATAQVQDRLRICRERNRGHRGIERGRRERKFRRRGICDQRGIGRRRGILYGSRRLLCRIGCSRCRSHDGKFRRKRVYLLRGQQRKRRQGGSAGKRKSVPSRALPG